LLIHLRVAQLTFASGLSRISHRSVTQLFHKTNTFSISETRA